MTILQVTADLLAESFDHFRRCGAGRNECVVYWTGPLDGPVHADRVEHPVHAASPCGYEVDGAWVTSFFLRLRRERRAARAQVHTHPHGACHSGTDDLFALVPAPGFLSLVIPNFALGPVSLNAAYLAEMDTEGRWIARSAMEMVAP